MTYPITTQKEVRRLFWERFAGYRNISKRKIRNYSGNGTMHNTDTRCAFVDYVDMLSRNGDISESLANRVTL